MALKLIVDSIESVPEAFRDEYVEREGKFHLSVEGIDSIRSENVALRTELDSIVLRTSIADALAAAGVTKEGADLMQERFANRLKFEKMDGNRVIAVMQADCKSPMAGSGLGGRATLRDLAQEAAETFPMLFRPEKGKAPKAVVAQDGNTMTRADFDMLSPAAKAEKMKAGVKLIDKDANVPPAKKPAPVVKTMIRRGDFEALSPADRMARMKSGFQLVD
jgi:hypothetical protein